MFYTLRRRLTKTVNEILYRVGYEDLRKAFDRLEVAPGSTLCVHSAVRNLGHLADGPGAVVRALQDAVGADGAVLMPTFSFAGSMLAKVKSGDVFDVRETSSKVGFLTEFFRKAY